MTTKILECTQCRRTIELVENPYGFETMGRCTITQDCRGFLFKVARLSGGVTNKIPDPVTELNDYLQRPMLYTHTQKINADRWIIPHNLGTAYTLRVYEEYIDGNQLTQYREIDDTTYTTSEIDRYTTKIELNQPIKGLAQFISRGTQPIVPTSSSLVLSTIIPEETVVIGTYDNTAQGTEIIVAVNKTNYSNKSIGINIHLSTGTTIISNSGPQYHPVWSQVEEISIGHTKYDVYGALLSDDVLQSVKIGGTFYINDITTNTSTPTTLITDVIDDVLLLYSMPPNDSSVDRELNSVIPISYAMGSSNYFLLRTDDGIEMYSSLHIDIFPPIKIS
jgi:hypothetical protein